MIAVGEVDTLHLDLECSGTDRFGIRCRRDRLGPAGEVDGAFPAGEGERRLVDHLGEFGDRDQDHLDQKDEGDRGPEGRPVDPEPDRAEEDGADGDRAEDVGNGEKHGRHPVGEELGGVELVDVVIEPVPRRVALAERPDGMGAGDRLVRLAQQVAGALTDRQHPALLFALERDQYRHHEREHGDGDEGELPGVDEHGDRRGQRNAGVDQPGVGPPVDETGERFDVAGGPRDEVALPFDGVLFE